MIGRVLACIAAAACAVGGAGCGGSEIQHAAASPDALCAAVLEAFERRDVGALQALALTEQEFQKIVWPELPAARPERNLSAEFVWADLRTKSEARLRQTIASEGGRRISLVRVQFSGGTSQYRTYLVHRDALLTIRDQASGERTARLFGSVLERDGRFKIFSYITD